MSKTGKMQYISRSTLVEAKHEAQGSRDHRNYIITLYKGHEAMVADTAK